jgi:hypothetical protein
MDQPDDLDEYLRGDSALSLRYRRESAPAPPHVLDRRVLRLSREALGRSPCLAPLAFAASVLLSVALVLAMVFGPQAAKRLDDNGPRIVRVAARADMGPNRSDVLRTRTAKAWLTDIAALRRAGRNDEAEAEYRRFLSAYPGYLEAAGAGRSNGALVIRP